MKLLIIRHGETGYNLDRRYCGFSNPSLNETGITQIESLAIRLNDCDVDFVYSSDLTRAVETAEILFKNCQILRMQNFREMNFGVLEGLTYFEIINRYPDIYRSWIANPLQTMLPEGETFNDFKRRIHEGLSHLLSKHKNQQIALITHGGPIRAILCAALNYEIDKFWQIEQDNSAINIIDYSCVHSPKVLELNNTSHLSGG